ncbi:MAG: hypothetical protein AB2392_16980 [Neobacillus sp.]
MEKGLKSIKVLEENRFLKREVHNIEYHVTFNDFVNSWFYEEYKLNVEPDTFRSCCFDMDHILAFFGDKIISEITMKDISVFHKSLDKGGFSDITIENIHRLFSELFYAALVRGLIKFV